MLMRLLKITLQTGLLTFFFQIGNLLSNLMHLPFPGSVIGLLLLFLSLKLRIIRLEWVELGATFLLAEMLIFFVPAAVGVLQYRDLVITEGPRIFIVIVLSTTLVMSVSGLLAEYLNKKREV